MTLVYCGQTVVWITIKIGKEVGIGPGHIVSDGDPVPLSPNGAQLPQFSAYVMPIVAKRLDGSICHLIGRYASAQATLC